MKQKQLFGTLLAFLLVLITIASAFAAPPFNNVNNPYYAFSNLVNDVSAPGSNDYDEDGIPNAIDLCPHIMNVGSPGNDLVENIDQDLHDDWFGNLCDPNNYPPYIIVTDTKNLEKGTTKDTAFVIKEGEKLIINLEGKYGDNLQSKKDDGTLFGIVKAHHLLADGSFEVLEIKKDPSIIGDNAIPLVMNLDKSQKAGADIANPFVTVDADKQDNKFSLEWTPKLGDEGEYVFTIKTLDGGKDLADHLKGPNDLQLQNFQNIFVKVEKGVLPNQCPSVTGIVMNPDPATVNEPVTLTAQTNDPDAGDSVVCTWKINNALLVGETSCTLNNILFPATGDQTVEVTATDGKEDAQGKDCASSLTKTFKANKPVNLCPTGQIKFDIPNPKQGDVITFSTSPNDPEQKPVECSWEINGNLESNECTFQYTVPNQNDLHVELFLSDGELTCESQGIVFTEPVLADEEDIPVEKNQCPLVEIFPKITTVVKGDSETFTGKVGDNNGDEVTCTWFVDGVEVFTNQAVLGICTFTQPFPASGVSIVTVTATDGKTDAQGNICDNAATAVVTVEEEIPPKENLCPTGNIKFTPEQPNKGDSITFTAVNINDDKLADESITCTWEINDKIASNECTFQYLVTDETLLHVELYLSDGELECLYPENIVDEEFIDIVPGNLCPVAEIISPEENPVFLTKGAAEEFIAQVYDDDQKPGDNPTACLWNINGHLKLGTGANGCTLLETFGQEGIFTVSLQLVTDQVDENNEQCAFAISKQVVVVEEPNSCPTGKIDYNPKIIKVGDDVTFEAIDKDDAQSDAITCAWEVNDVKVSDECNFVLQDAQAGNYHVELFLADGEAECAYPSNEVAEVDVTVPTEPEKQLCTAILDAVPQKAVEPATVDFSCENSNINPKGTSFTCAWDLGDGSTEDDKSFKHLYKTAGNYHVGLTVTTADGTTCTDQATIKVEHKRAPEEEPREALELIQADLLNGEFYCPGEDAELLLTLQNIRADPLEDLKTTVHVTDLNAFWHVGEFDLGVNDKKTIFMPLHVPEDADPGEYTVRVYAGNDDLARIIHRRIVVEQCQ